MVFIKTFYLKVFTGMGKVIRERAKYLNDNYPGISVEVLIGWTGVKRILMIHRGFESLSSFQDFMEKRMDDEGYKKLLKNEHPEQIIRVENHIYFEPRN